MLKQKIKANFNQAANSYEQEASVQKMSSMTLLKKVYELEPNFNPLSILDLGAATGLSAELLYEKYSQAKFTLNDLAPQMLQKAQDKFKLHDNFKFILGDLEKINFADHDLVFSNLALQWASNLTATLHKIFRAAKILAFSHLMPGTFEQWQNIIQNFYPEFKALNYFEHDHLVKIIEKLRPSKYLTHVNEVKLFFPGAKALMIHLKKLGAQTSPSNLPIHIVKNIISNYNQKIELNYKIFFAVLKR